MNLNIIHTIFMYYVHIILVCNRFPNGHQIWYIKHKAETPEVGGGHVPLQNWGYQLTLFRPRGADYARHITTAPPSFWTVRRL